MQERNFLFLQGMASQFFSELGAALRMRGHGVNRINFNGGDVAFWPFPGAISYRGDLAAWPSFLADQITRLQITDIVLFGDCRPVHRRAITVAAALGIPVYVFEEGYLRPNWITLERGGVNAHSSLGRTPQWFVEAASGLDPWKDGAVAINKMSRRAIEDIVYVMATQLLGVCFPAYRSHRPWSSWVEYAGGARRFFQKPAAKRQLAEMIEQLSRAGRPYYLFPLQLESDSQIRHHFHLGSMKPAIEQVIRSFSAHAPSDAVLIVTEHPLDTSPFDWRRIVADIGKAFDMADRVRFFEGGSSEAAITGCRGLVTINSTIGYLALGLGKPLIAMGQAIYNMAELTFQDGLDVFWSQCTPPNPTVFDAFRRVVAARTQINGSFFSDTGLELAVAGAVARIEADWVAKPVTSPTSDFVGQITPAEPIFQTQSQA